MNTIDNRFEKTARTIVEKDGYWGDKTEHAEAVANRRAKNEKQIASTAFNGFMQDILGHIVDEGIEPVPYNLYTTEHIIRKRSKEKRIRHVGETQPGWFLDLRVNTDPYNTLQKAPMYEYAPLFVAMVGDDGEYVIRTRGRAETRKGRDIFVTAFASPNPTTRWQERLVEGGEEVGLPKWSSNAGPAAHVGYDPEHDELSLALKRPYNIKRYVKEPLGDVMASAIGRLKEERRNQ